MHQNTYIFEQEASFEVRSRDDKVLAEFSIQQLKDRIHYQTHLKLGNLESQFSERLPTYYGQEERILVYHGQDRQSAINAAHQAACYLARQFNPEFEDFSNFTDGSAFISYGKK